MSIAAALERMADFAGRTGLAPDSPGPPRRYLWTDAFAVCNFLELSRVTGDGAHARMALRLVDQVHDVLGRVRDGDARLGDADDHHPTRGGLRIGKPLPEREEDEPFDARLEWERDGQYFHYLTKWMHALDQTARATGRAELQLWAHELADTAHRAFAQPAGPEGRPRMAWKMSTDLSRALVPSMGHHDPLDGLVTYVQLKAGAATLSESASLPDLDEAIGGFAAMLEGADWVTDDALGIGGLLGDALRVHQLSSCRRLADSGLLPRLLASALLGLRHWAGHSELRRPASQRLAFRELGLCIGLRAVSMLREHASNGDIGRVLEALARFVPLADTLETYWLDPAHRGSAHRDIDDVMLATALVPAGYLCISETAAEARERQPRSSACSSVAMPHTPAIAPRSSSSGLR